MSNRKTIEITFIFLVACQHDYIACREQNYGTIKVVIVLSVTSNIILSNCILL